MVMAGNYSGRGYVESVDKNNCLARDYVFGYATSCVEGNGFINRVTNSTVKGNGYYEYLNTKSRKWERKTVKLEDKITKSGERKYLNNKKKIYPSDVCKYTKDEYSVAIQCKFNLTCNNCGAVYKKTLLSTR